MLLLYSDVLLKVDFAKRVLSTIQHYMNPGFSCVWLIQQLSSSSLKSRLDRMWIPLSAIHHSSPDHTSHWGEPYRNGMVRLINRPSRSKFARLCARIMLEVGPFSKQIQFLKLLIPFLRYWLALKALTITKKNNSIVKRGSVLHASRETKP